MTEQTPMTEERLRQCEYILGEITSPYRGYINHDGDRENAQKAQEDVFAEISRLKEENERLKNTLNSHEPDGRNYTNQQYVDLLNQQQKLIEVLEWIRDAGADYQSINKAREALKVIEHE